MLKKLTDFAHRLILRIADHLHFPASVEHGSLLSYLMTVFLMALSLWVRLAIAPISAGLQYVTFFPAVTVSAIAGGYRAGLLATAFGLVFATYIFTPPYYSFSIAVLQASMWSNLVFLMDGIIISFAIESMHRYRERYALELKQSKKAEDALRTSMELLKEAQHIAHLGAWELDLVTGKLDWSDEVFHIFEVDLKRFGSSYEAFLSVVHPDDRDRVNQTYTDSLKYHAPYEITHRLLMNDGRVKWVHERGVSEFDASGIPLRSKGMVQDITERKQIEDQVSYLAFYDQLTSLPNRRLLFDRLSHAMATSKRSGYHSAVMFLDLDNFKPLNDRHGHAVGDLLLIEVADRLKSCIREMDTVARYGGDEFVVIISELKADHAESIEEAGIIAAKILSTLSEPYLLTLKQEGETDITVEHHCAASIGVVLFIGHDASQDDILRWADAAMYQAKKSGRNSIRFYDPKA